jgi:DNA-binding MarR family transcriptional regulator
MHDSGSFAGIEESILVASRIMVNILAESLLQEKAEQITVPQFRILDMIYNLTDKPAEIARMLGVSPPAITSMLERLEARGYLRRLSSRGDRRRVELRLTEEGSDLVTRVNAHRRKALKRVLNGMEEGTRSELGTSLQDFSRSYFASKERAI